LSGKTKTAKKFEPGARKPEKRFRDRGSMDQPVESINTILRHVYLLDDIGSSNVVTSYEENAAIFSCLATHAPTPPTIARPPSVPNHCIEGTSKLPATLVANAVDAVTWEQIPTAPRTTSDAVPARQPMRNETRLLLRDYPRRTWGPERDSMLQYLYRFWNIAQQRGTTPTFAELEEASSIPERQLSMDVHFALQSRAQQLAALEEACSPYKSKGPSIYARQLNRLANDHGFELKRAK
jgi:hypothetical protein